MTDTSRYILRVDTLASGPFTFSAKCDDFNKEILPDLIRAQVHFATIRDLPILPELASRLEDEYIIKSIFGTAAIEGNPLSENQVEELIKSQEPDVEKVKSKANREILNLKNVYAFVGSLKDGEYRLLTEDFIKDVHRRITQGLESPENTPGTYRNHKVKVGDEAHGGVYTPPRIYEDVSALMSKFVQWINSDELVQQDPAVRAALAHYHFALIHPFGDGNGRTARVLEAVILRSAGVKFVPAMLSNYYYRNLDEYFTIFNVTRKSQDNSVSPFLTFFMKALVAALEEIKSRIVHFIRVFSLRDYYHYLRLKRSLTQRQHDLIMLWLDSQQPITLPELFVHPRYTVLYRGVSERTARRDIKKLLELGLIQETAEKKLRINIATLG